MMRDASGIGSLNCLGLLTLLFKKSMQHSTQGWILSWNQRLDHRAVDTHAGLLQQGLDIKPLLEVPLCDIEYP
jgi:hypothetical protein